MRGRTTVLLLVLFAALLVYVLRFERGKPSPAAEAEEARTLVDLAAGSVDRIRVEATSDTLELRRRDDDGHWYLLYPVLDRADGAIVQAFLDEFDPLLAAARPEGSAAERIRYRLDRPSFTVTFGRLTTGGRRETVLQVGRKNTTLGAYYAMADRDSFRLGLIDAELVERYLNRDPMAYRYRRIADIDPVHANRVVVRTRSGWVAAERGPMREWKIVAPIEAQADQAAINELIQRFAAQRILDFTDEAPGDLAPYGLVKPAVSIEVGLESEVSFILEIGDCDSTERRCFARRNGTPYVFTIPAVGHGELAKSLFDLRERRLFPIQPGAVERLEIEGGERRFVAEREERSWKLVLPSGERKPLRGYSVDAAVQNLSVLRARSFLDGGPAAAAEAGLRRPALSVRVRLRGGETHEVVFASREGRILARRLPAGPVVEIPEGDTALLEGFLDTPPLAGGAAGTGSR